MIKNIEINNQKDLNKFYKRLFIYRSFLYKKVTFTVKKDKYNITDIINALNIKKRKQRLEFIYDTCCKEIDDFYDHKDICHFKNNKCLVQQQLGNGNINGCCRLCPFQSEKGCQTKNLTCKLFTCSEVQKRCPVIKFEDLNLLKVLTRRQRHIIRSSYFSKRESVLFDLYIGSILLWTIRIVIRWLYGFYYVKKHIYKHWKTKLKKRCHRIIIL